MVVNILILTWDRSYNVHVESGLCSPMAKWPNHILFAVYDVSPKYTNTTTEYVCIYIYICIHIHIYIYTYYRFHVSRWTPCFPSGSPCCNWATQVSWRKHHSARVQFLHASAAAWRAQGIQNGTWAFPEIFGGFHKWWYPHTDSLQWKIPLVKWMI